MLSALSGYASIYQTSISSTLPPPPVTAVAVASPGDRSTSLDTVTISAAGMQASQAAQGADQDGDSH